MPDGVLASDRTFRIGLLWITVAGALWRLGYLLLVKLDDDVMLNDALYYSMQAGRNGEGDWFREGLADVPGAEHGPLTSLYLTPWSRLPGDLVAWQRVATTLLGIATVAVIGLVGRRLAGRMVGLVAAAIAAIYPNLWLNDSLIMSETLACLLVSVALLLALRFDARPTLGRATALGAVVGLAALTRSELALLAVGFAVLAWWRSPVGRSRVLAPISVVAVTVAVIAPWSLYNLSRFEQPVLLSTNDGTTLAGANCDPVYDDDIGGWDVRCAFAVPGGDDEDPSVVSRERRSVGLRYVRDHLDRVPVVVLARVGRLLDLYGLDSMTSNDVREEKAEWAVWAGIVCWWLLAIGAIVGWLALRRRGTAQARARWWLAVPLAAVLVTAILFYGAHRIRAPAEPAVVVLAATGLVATLHRRPRPASPVRLIEAVAP